MQNQVVKWKVKITSECRRYRVKLPGERHAWDLGMNKAIYLRQIEKIYDR